jgi:hypothetical protein
VLFIMTEDLSGEMIFVDKITLWYICILALQLVLALAVKISDPDEGNAGSE